MSVSEGIGSAGGFPVDQAGFSGPLELLLRLAERSEVDLASVSLGVLADEFLMAVEAMPECEPDVLADFLSLCSQLLVLKARQLLPELADLMASEEPVDLDALEREIRARLAEYQRYRAVALALSGSQPEGPAFPLRPSVLPVPPQLEVELAGLVSACQAIWKRLPAAPIRIARQAWDIVGRMRWLRERLASARGGEGRPGELDAEALFADVTSRAEAVVVFLALLELLRLGEIKVRQEAPFANFAVRLAA